MVTAALLIALGATPARARLFAEPMAAACALHGIHEKADVAAFAAQCAHESAGFSRMEEDLAYKTPARLDAMFSAVKGEADAAALIKRGPQAIACRVYANRNGNRDEASGDGWRFRGQGLIQLTGRRNFAQAGAALGMPLETQPELATTPTGAAMTAAWFWLAHDCTRMALRGDVAGITKEINGAAMEGLEQRRALTRTALEALA